MHRNNILSFGLLMACSFYHCFYYSTLQPTFLPRYLAQRQGLFRLTKTAINTEQDELYDPQKPWHDSIFSGQEEWIHNEIDAQNSYDYAGPLAEPSSRTLPRAVFKQPSHGGTGAARHNNGQTMAYGK